MAAPSQTTGLWFAVFGFIPQEASNLIIPYVTLVVEGGEEFKAHRGNSFL